MAEACIPGGAGRQCWRTTLGLAVALVLGGALMAAIRPDAVPLTGLPVGGNRPVDPMATEPTTIEANNSPSLAQNPADRSNLVVVNRVDLPGFSCSLNVSRDAGVSWQRGSIPFPAGEESPPRCFAPDVAFGADGTMYVAFATLKGAGNVPNAVWLSASGDGGLTLSRPEQVLGPLAFQVRLISDPGQGGRLYLTWLQAADTGTLSLPARNNPIRFSRSEDGGRSWSAAVTVNPPSRHRVLAPVPAIAPGGGIDVLYLDVGDDAVDYQGLHRGQGGDPYPGNWSLLLARSSDGGGSWNETVVDAQVVPTQRFIVFLPPAPSLAVDQRNGRVYVAFTDGRSGDADVWLWVSGDRGRRFRDPVRVNDTPPADGTSQYLPKVAVAPSGRVDLLYYDRRADRSDVLNEVSLQSSDDGGASFGPSRQLSDRPFDSRIGFGSERRLPDLGSRLALLSTDTRSLAIWPDTRAGDAISNKQDLALQLVLFMRAAPDWGPRRLAGAAATIGGFVLLLTTFVRRKARQKW